MSSISPLRLAAAALLCVSLSLVWGAGAHLHLCFDGLEPAVTVHAVADGGDHLAHHSPEHEHSDLDVEFDANLRRVSKSGADTHAIQSSVTHASSSARTTIRLGSADAPSGVRPAARYSQPPLRAPPA